MKIVWCRPHGGLNDMLTQIDKCIDYANKFNRCLLIDTSRSGFLSCFSNYFTSTDHITYGIVKPTSTTTCYPHCLDGRLAEYAAPVFNHDNQLLRVDIKYQVPVTFNFNIMYQEDILVHEQGGWDVSTTFMSTVRFKPYLSSRIKQVLKSLGTYTAIHVRNTDYKTDYITWFDTLKQTVTGTVVVCTDNLECREYATSLWGDNLVVVTPLPDVDGAPLHYNNNINRLQANLASLIDLAVLAGSTTLHTTKLITGNESGYGRLARMMHNDKSILTHLLGDK